MKHKYTLEQKAFIEANIKGTLVKDLVIKFNKKFGINLSYDQIRSYLGHRGLKSGVITKTSRKSPFIDEQCNFIAKNAKGKSNKDLLEMLNNEFASNFTINQLKGHKARNKIKSGLTGRWEKGHVPFNKGRKGIRHSPATEFKKGQIPANARPVGSKRITKDGYTEVKVKGRKKWVAEHRLVWEQANGPIPKGSVILFLDQNKQNCNLDNLVMITRAELNVLNKNGLIKPHSNLTKSGVLVAKVILKAAERRKDGNKKSIDRS